MFSRETQKKELVAMLDEALSETGVECPDAQTEVNMLCEIIGILYRKLERSPNGFTDREIKDSII